MHLNHDFISSEDEKHDPQLSLLKSDSMKHKAKDAYPDPAL